MKTEKKEFSFSNKKEKQGARAIEGNQEQNGINIIMGSLVEFVTTLGLQLREPNSPSLHRKLHGHLGTKEAERDELPLLIAALPQDETVLINISPSGRQAAKRLET